MMQNYKINELRRQIQIMAISPLDVLVVGVTGAGKSSTLNTLFGNDIVKVGEGVAPETMNASTHSLNDYFRIWDTPGLGDGKQKDIEHSRQLTNILYKTYEYGEINYGFIDLVLVIIEGSHRDMGTTYKLLNEIITPNIQKDRILVAVNQADLAMKGRYWDYNENKPKEKLIEFLDAKVISIQRRIKEATGAHTKLPVYYSAKYGFNIDKLFDFILGNMPRGKRGIKM